MQTEWKLNLMARDHLQSLDAACLNTAETVSLIDQAHKGHLLICCGFLLMNEETQIIPEKPVIAHSEPGLIDDLLRNIDPAQDDETERFVASICADRHDAAQPLGALYSNNSATGTAPCTLRRVCTSWAQTPSRRQCIRTCAE
jgi:hypothetical protein